MYPAIDGELPKVGAVLYGVVSGLDIRNFELLSHWYLLKRKNKSLGDGL